MGVKLDKMKSHVPGLEHMTRLGMMAHACDPSPRKAEAEGLAGGNCISGKQVRCRSSNEVRVVKGGLPRMQSPGLTPALHQRYREALACDLCT